jgi:hypothetical protein
MSENEETRMDEEMVIRAKWTMDGAETLSQAASALRLFADELEKAERDGWQLDQPIADDYGFVSRRLPAAPV